MMRRRFARGRAGETPPLSDPEDDAANDRGSPPPNRDDDRLLGRLDGPSSSTSDTSAQHQTLDQRNTQHNSHSHSERDREAGTDFTVTEDSKVPGSSTDLLQDWSPPDKSTPSSAREGHAGLLSEGGGSGSWVGPQDKSGRGMTADDYGDLNEEYDTL